MADEDDKAELTAAGPSADSAAAFPGSGEGWELAIGLIRAWRGAGERADGCTLHRRRDRGARDSSVAGEGH